MPSNVLLLETVLLNSFVGEDSWVYVRVGDSYVRKKAKDLQEGDLIVVNNEGINKGLKDVEPVLEQSIRYLVAKRTLHETNRNGQDIKKFRILLLRGLADPSTPNLEQKIMLEGDNFSSREYTLFEDRVLSHILGVEEDAVRKWLYGGTWAPRDWNNFARLVPINQEFQAIADSFGQTMGYYAAYQLFTGLRRTIMSYIAKRTGIPKTDVSETETSPHPDISGKYKKEIELVVGHFMQEVDRTKSATRIIKIKPIEITREEGESRETQKPDPNLRKGVFVGELNLPLLNMNQIRQELYFLDNALYDALNNYSLHKLMSEEPISPETIFCLPTLPIYLFTRLIRISPVEKSLLENNLRVLYRPYGVTRSRTNQKLGEYYTIFLRELQEGHIDKVLGVEENTVAHLVDLVNPYRSAMPRSYFEQKIVNVNRKMTQAELEELRQQRVPRHSRREKEREVQRLMHRYEVIEKYLIDVYGIQPNPKSFFITAVEEGMGVLDISKPRHDLTDAQLRDLKRQLEVQGAKFYEKGEVLAVLSRLGVGEAIKFYNQRTFI